MSPSGLHPISRRLCLAAYRAGMERVAALRRAHPPPTILPALYGCRRVVAALTIGDALRQRPV